MNGLVWDSGTLCESVLYAFNGYALVGLICIHFCEVVSACYLQSYAE